MNDERHTSDAAEEQSGKAVVGHGHTPGWRGLLRRKWVLIGGGVAVVVLLGVGGFLVFGKNENPDKAANAQGYEFLTMAACNEHFKKQGASPNEVNKTCMRLEKELIAKQASGSNKDFVPMSLECNDPPLSQWYRTDDTFVVDHKNPDTMYVNVEWKGLHKSTDGGKTWKLKVKNIIVDHRDKNTGKNCYGEYPVAIMDPTNNKRILLATSGGGGGTLKDQNMRGGGVYETTDGAETWKQKITDTMNGFTTHALVFDPKNPQSFYYGTAASPASYTEADPNKIWVTKGLIYKTPNNGKTWTELPTGFIKGASLMSIVIDPADPNKITASTRTKIRNAEGPNTVTAEQMGIIQTTDGGTTWKRIDNLPKGYEAAQKHAAAPRNVNNMFFIASTNGEQAKSKSFYSTDGGKTWAESAKALDLFAYDPNDATGKRLLGYEWQCYSTPGCSKTLYQSMDAGKTWSTFGTLPTEAQDLGDRKSHIQNIVWHPTDKNTFFMTGAGAHVWKTTDNGSTWTTLLTLDKVNKK